MLLFVNEKMKLEIARYSNNNNLNIFVMSGRVVVVRVTHAHTNLSSLGRANVVTTIMRWTDDVMTVMMIRRMMMMVVVVVVMVGRVGSGGGGRCSSSRSRRVLARVGVAMTGLLSLAVLLVLHTSILEPYFDLTFRQIQITRQLPTLLLRNVGIEQEFFFQFQRLELGVRLPLLTHRHLARPFQRVWSKRTFFFFKERRKFQTQMERVSRLWHNLLLSFYQ